MKGMRKKYELRILKKPIPIEGEALVQIEMAGICGTDLSIVGGKNPMVKPPVIPGHEFIGRCR